MRVCEEVSFVSFRKKRFGWNLGDYGRYLRDVEVNRFSELQGSFVLTVLLYDDGWSCDGRK